MENTYPIFSMAEFFKEKSRIRNLKAMQDFGILKQDVGMKETIKMADLIKWEPNTSMIRPVSMHSMMKMA